MISTFIFLSSNATARNLDQFDYFGLSIQNNNYDNIDFFPKVNTSELSPLLYKSSSSAIGYRVFIGHQFNRYIGVESGISSLGKGEFSVTQQEENSDGVTERTTVYNGKFKTLTGDIRIIGTFPLSKSVFIKAHAGALLWDNDFTFLSGEINNLELKQQNDTDISLLTGIGIACSLNNNIAFSLDLENIKIANITTHNLNLSLLISL